MLALTYSAIEGARTPTTSILNRSIRLPTRLILSFYLLDLLEQRVLLYLT